MKFDFLVLDFIQSWLRCGFLDKVMTFVTKLGDGGAVWIALTIVFLISDKYRKLGAAVAVSLVCCLLVGNGFLKEFFARLRPFNINEIPLLITPPTGFSFPSGHTMSSFAAANAIFLIRKKWGIWAFVLAFLIAFSRMYLYVHFLTDVLAGAALGLIFGWAGCAAVYRKLRFKKGRRYEY